MPRVKHRRRRLAAPPRLQHPHQLPLKTMVFAKAFLISVHLMLLSCLFGCGEDPPNDQMHEDIETIKQQFEKNVAECVRQTYEEDCALRAKDQIRLPPSEIRFPADSISAEFDNGKDLEKAYRDMHSQIDSGKPACEVASAFPLITIVRMDAPGTRDSTSAQPGTQDKGGEWWVSEGMRRLFILQLLQQDGLLLCCTAKISDSPIPTNEFHDQKSRSFRAPDRVRTFGGARSHSTSIHANVGFIQLADVATSHRAGGG